MQSKYLIHCERTQVSCPLVNNVTGQIRKNVVAIEKISGRVLVHTGTCGLITMANSRCGGKNPIVRLWHFQANQAPQSRRQIRFCHIDPIFFIKI
jgi:hypothetical protein